MDNKLKFDPAQYTVQTVELDGESVTFRAFEDITYVENPVDPEMQKLNVFAPEAFFAGESINGYDLHSAPIFMPNTVGGYRPGPVDRPGRDRDGKANAIFYALRHGCVVVSPGLRGNGRKDADGKLIGTAPAVICDYKAAVRWVRHNRGIVPGDVEKIITNGTSAGGAISSLMGASGNHPDYAPYLKEMGAADERDDIFAASCYCPITNLDHADMAYEWEFCGIIDYHRRKMIPPGPGEDKPTFIPIDEDMTAEQIKLSELLKPMFPGYLNSLGLKDDQGNALTLDEQGNGSFKDYVLTVVARSAQGQLDAGADLSELDWLSVENGKVTAIDFDKYVAFRTRMKPAPAFDSNLLDTPENHLFGSPDISERHFTAFGHAHSSSDGERAEEILVKLMNPMNYIDDDKATTARHYRIRHGSVDRDTSLAVSAMLTAKLRMSGVNANLEYPWGVPHSGDYDLPELFAWIDSICK